MHVSHHTVSQINHHDSFIYDCPVTLCVTSICTLMSSHWILFNLTQLLTTHEEINKAWAKIGNEEKLPYRLDLFVTTSFAIGD